MKNIEDNDSDVEPLREGNRKWEGYPGEMKGRRLITEVDIRDPSEE
jgi:hypothetical protein